MSIPVKLARIKSRAKRRGRPKYKYVLRWPGPQGWQQESCGTSDGKSAEALRKQKWRELNGLVASEHEATDEPAALTWDVLLANDRVALESRDKAAQTVEGYARSVGQLRDLIDADSPAHVDAAGIEQFIAARRKAGIVAATINRDLRQLRSVFNRAIRRGELHANPFSNFDKLNEDREEIRILSPAEIRQICAHFAGSPLLQTFLLVSLQTGCRIRELAYLLTDDVDRETGWLMIRTKDLHGGGRWRPKSKAGIRDVWLPPWLMQGLIAIDRRGRKPFVWSAHLTDIGRPFGDDFDPERFVPFVQHRIEECWGKIGIPRFTHHDLRRTQQTWLREKGWGDAVCLAVAGQSSGAVVLRNHDWRPNHRRMTLPAFQDVTVIFSESGVVEGDPLGDTCRIAGNLDHCRSAASRVG